jgi:transposase
MSKAIEVITSVERRRRWSAGEKEWLVAASLEPGASVCAAAGEAGIHSSQLYGRRRQLLRVSEPEESFAAVRIATEPPPGDLSARGVIEEEFANGSRMRINGAIDPATLTTTIATLAGGDDDLAACWRPVWLATGNTDMRKGFDGPALLMQETLKRNPLAGHLFVFRGRRGNAKINGRVSASSISMLILG